MHQKERFRREIAGARTRLRYWRFPLRESLENSILEMSVVKQGTRERGNPRAARGHFGLFRQRG